MDARANGEYVRKDKSGSISGLGEDVFQPPDSKEGG